MTNSSNATIAGGQWAEVHARDDVTRYRRSGAGPAVLLLDTPGHEDAAWPELREALDAGFRTIVPELPGSARDLLEWLESFLEGLGTARVGLIATGIYCIPALELASRGGDQVARMVLVPAGEADDTRLEGVLTTRVHDAPVPLLVVRRALPAGKALPLIRSFLAGEEAPG